MKKSIPAWIFIWALLMATLPLGFVLVGYFNPGYYGEEWADKGISIYGGVFGFYIARNMASGLIMLVALWQRSALLIIGALLMRIFSDFFDGAHAIVAGTGDMNFWISAFVMITGCSFAIFKLWPLREKGELTSPD